MGGGCIGLQQFRLEAEGSAHESIRGPGPVGVLPSGTIGATAARHAAACKLLTPPLSLLTLLRVAFEDAIHLAEALSAKPSWD